MSMGIIKDGEYDKVAGNSDNTELTRNLHDPDWTNAVRILSTSVILQYTVPQRGFICGYYVRTANSGAAHIIVNPGNVYVAVSDESSEHATVFIPVSAGDIVTSDLAIQGSIYFVPYKAQ